MTASSKHVGTPPVLDGTAEHLRHGLGRLALRVQQVLAAGRARGDQSADADAALEPLVADAGIAALELPLDAGLVPATKGSRITGLGLSFGLDDRDLDVLVAALAPDLDRRFEALYNALGTPASGRASIGLALELAGGDPWLPQDRRRFAADQALARFALLDIGESGPFLSRSLSVPDRVTAHLLGDLEHDPALRSLVVPAVPQVVGDVAGLARAIGEGWWLCWVREAPGAAGSAMAAAALGYLGLDTVSLELDHLPPGASLASAATLGLREAGLVDGGLIVRSVDPARDAAAFPLFFEPPCPVVLVSTSAWDPRWSTETPYLAVAPVAEHRIRQEIWAEMASRLGAESDEDQLDDIARSFRLRPEDIVAAAAAAAASASGRGEKATADDLRSGARAQNSGRLEKLARHKVPVATFDDVVLPPHAIESLRRIGDRVRHRDLVRSDWGMDRVAGRAGGVTCLFSGPSGTGKTLSAEVIAYDLGVDLYTIDLSQVVDKYIGETEKNLERIFSEAEGVNGVLFFDEADALFGKRSDVRNSNDRHANIEVAYLLQRMQQFEGVAVLATNLPGNLDDAFSRRLDVSLRFDEPDEAARRRLFELHLPATLPIGELDYDLLASLKGVTGGMIANVCVEAAFAAASAGRTVEMGDLVRAIALEYTKKGRLVDAGVFGAWAAELDPSAVDH